MRKLKGVESNRSQKMANENETVMSVCAEWRACIESADPTVWSDERIAGLVKTTKAQQIAYLDRIEAARKRDEERAVEHATRHAEAVARDNCRDCIHNPNGKNYEPVGNAAAMRDALVKIYTCVDDCDNYDPESKIDEVIGIADAALSAPPRQCDVGTAAEQVVRFRAECYKHFCNNCRFGNDQKTCGIKWAQAPYEAEGGEG